MTLQLGTFGAWFNPVYDDAARTEFVVEAEALGYTTASPSTSTPAPITSPSKSSPHPARIPCPATGSSPAPSPDAQHQGIAPHPQELARECRSQTRLERRSCLTEPPRHR
jgi:hypothetical protein